MKVYIVMRNVEYEFGEVWEVHKSKEQAEKVKKDLQERYGKEYVVEEWDVRE